MAPGLGQQKLALFPLRRSPTPTWYPDTQRPPQQSQGPTLGCGWGGFPFSWVVGDLRSRPVASTPSHQAWSPLTCPVPSPLWPPAPHGPR